MVGSNIDSPFNLVIKQARLMQFAEVTGQEK